jgi:YesN/AraC family two-component response regulator
MIKNGYTYKSIIESHFNTNLPFLNPNFNLNNLSKEIGLPKHIISSFINQEYRIGFRKLINQKRVDYLIENFKKPEWKNLTLEAIANESGFKNRSTFIINFKEVTGKNPFEYFKNIKQ